MTTDFDNYIADQYQYAVDRTFMVWTIQRDLYDAALSLGADGRAGAHQD